MTNGVSAATVTSVVVKAMAWATMETGWPPAGAEPDGAAEPEAAGEPEGAAEPEANSSVQQSG